MKTQEKTFMERFTDYVHCRETKDYEQAEKIWKSLMNECDYMEKKLNEDAIKKMVDKQPKI